MVPQKLVTSFTCICSKLLQWIELQVVQLTFLAQDTSNSQSNLFQKEAGVFIRIFSHFTPKYTISMISDQISLQDNFANMSGWTVAIYRVLNVYLFLKMRLLKHNKYINKWKSPIGQFGSFSIWSQPLCQDVFCLKNTDSTLWNETSP